MKSSSSFFLSFLCYLIVLLQAFVGSAGQKLLDSNVHQNNEKASYPELFDYVFLMDEDSYNTANDKNLYNLLQRNEPMVQKRPNIKLIPRIGRKKRSITDEQNEEGNEMDHKMSEVDITDTIWDNLLDKRAIFVPRVGRSSYTPSTSRYGPRLRYKSRGSFIPRIG